jgi:ferredoxin-NADP reductase
VAVARTATVVATRELSNDVRLLELSVAGGLGFTGGQYIIVDSGALLADGKKAKRAYSILSSDESQERIQLAVKRLGNGPGSSFMHRLQPGDPVPFSGPWGKFLPDDARPRRTLVLATDTGITAALGLIRGKSFVPQRASTTLIWLVPGADYFLPEAMVRELLPAGVRFEMQHALQLPDDAFESGFFAGDGKLIYPLRETARFAVRLEAFFNNPEKKSV